MNRILQTIKINSELELVRLKGDIAFKHPLGYILPKGYCFKHSIKGYLSFDDVAPYAPCGGKKALLSIMESGGFLNFDNAVWLQPLTSW